MSKAFASVRYVRSIRSKPIFIVSREEGLRMLRSHPEAEEANVRSVAVGCQKCRRDRACQRMLIDRVVCGALQASGWRRCRVRLQYDNVSSIVIII